MTRFGIPSDKPERKGQRGEESLRAILDKALYNQVNNTAPGYQGWKVAQARISTREHVRNNMLFVAESPLDEFDSYRTFWQAQGIHGNMVGELGVHEKVEQYPIGCKVNQDGAIEIHTKGKLIYSVSCVVSPETRKPYISMVYVTQTREAIEEVLGKLANMRVANKNEVNCLEKELRRLLKTTIR